jgi:hypothetical protein
MDHPPSQACSLSHATENGIIGKKIEVRGVRSNFMRLLTVVQDSEEEGSIQIWLGSAGEECKC